uniref:DNA-directed RNA polymerase II subunit RPB9-like zinc ribbon domain-containing protein n=1 Tax=Lactuca sativa TaxID=4236 RepID=A0A9R1X6H0_LACSA|nr:hypothetical protein LSAT_V11C600329020 [Lactuca sativa]
MRKSPAYYNTKELMIPLIELETETRIQHKATDIEGELHEMRSGFLQAENRLNDMKTQWGRIRENLAIVGLNLPLDLTVVEDHLAKDPGDEICHQLQRVVDIEFCPTYGMLLKYELSNLHLPARFFCPTCPYVSQIEQKIKRKQCLIKKEIDPIITQDDMKNAPKTDQSQIMVTTRLHTSNFKQGRLMNP